MTEATRREAVRADAAVAEAARAEANEAEAAAAEEARVEAKARAEARASFVRDMGTEITISGAIDACCAFCDR